MVDLILTIVVCTYNRKELLDNCLSSLEKQTAYKKEYEILTIDNNSKDDTRNVASKYVKTHDNFRYLSETKQGLSYSRNKGWKEARGEFVGYIDDDSIADKDWIKRIIEFVNEKRDVQAFGGPYDRYTIEKLPTWFPPEYGKLFLGNKIRKVDIGKEWITGTNMVFKKDLLKRLGGFNTSLGMSGKKLAYGEEAELLRRIAKKGIAVYYNPKMIVKHLIDGRKVSFYWLLKSSYFNGINFWDIHGIQPNLISSIYSIVRTVLLAPKVIFNRKGPTERKLYYALSNIFFSFGQLRGAL